MTVKLKKMGVQVEILEVLRVGRKIIV